MFINDPVFGFIEVEKGLLTDLVKSPYFTRLQRIKQLGPTFHVYPGAMHTRFQHSIGTLHLVSAAIESLRNKGVDISEDECEGTQIAMLLHDAGHGPMSHALENSFISGVSHEEISLLIMKQINKETNGSLDIAIQIFCDKYPKHFLHELICSQLDMDRLDYLCRDSFFTGVKEGNIGVARIIKMLNVRNDRLVVEQKGIYTIENYLMARRLMYWQVYLHKTVMAAQELLQLAMKRAKELAQEGMELFCTPNLHYFLYHDINKAYIEQHPDWLNNFKSLDDSDIEVSLKQWCNAPDKVLSLLASNYIYRNLFKVKEIEQPLTSKELDELYENISKTLGVSKAEAQFFVRNKETDLTLYSSLDDHIFIHFKDDTTRDIADFSELLSSDFTNKKSRRYYLFYQR